MLTERLALLVSLDPDKAVNGLEKIGKAADRNLGKATTGIDKTGAALRKTGAGMAAFGTLALVGLGKLAQASEEANLAQVKLQNSLDRNPRLAGENIDKFNDLAQAIQSKTAADGDAVVSGLAMLGTFKVTGDQMRELTPLVVDYARKFGVDLVTANAAVGKALDGSIGALKRNGVSIDEALFKTDRYAAVQQALAEQVGGFAEAEGKTFAGSLARLKNEMGDLAEGVGVGAVEAFQTLLGPVHSVADALTGLDPGLLGTAGKVATFGAAGLTAAGGLSFMVGKAIELRSSIADLPNRLKTLGSGMGSLKGTAGIAAAGIGLFALAMFKAQQRGENLRQAARELSDEAERTGKTLEEVALGKLARTFAESDQVSRAMDDLGVSFADLRGPLQGSQADFDAWRESMLDADQQIGAVGNQGDFLADRVAILRGELAEATEVTTRTAQATGALAISDEDAAAAQEEAAAAAQELSDKLKAQADAYDDLLDAVLSQFSADIGYRKSLDDTEDALTDVNDALKAHGPQSEEYARSLLDGEQALIDQAAAAVRLADDTAKASGESLNAAEKNAVYRAELVKLAESLDPNSPLRAKLLGFVSDLDALPKSVSVQILADAGGAFATVQEFLSYLNTIGIKSPSGHTLTLGFQQARNRAVGGEVEAGQPHWVGEGGRPELFIPNQDGRIITAQQLASMSSRESVVREDSSGGGGSQTIVNIYTAADSQSVVEAVSRYVRTNGQPPWLRN